jgi:hypothetical protein
LKKVNAARLTSFRRMHRPMQLRSLFKIQASVMDAETALHGGRSGNVRAMKIYVRERQKVGTGVHQPRFRVVAVIGEGITHSKIEAVHFRKTELDQIAKDLGAEVVYLEVMPEEKRGAMMEAKT